MMVLDLYVNVACRKPLPLSDKKVIILSNIIGTTARSVHLKMKNYQWIDTDGSAGRENPSQQSVDVFKEYAHNEQLLSAAIANCLRNRVVDLVECTSLWPVGDFLGKYVSHQDDLPEALNQVMTLLMKDTNLSFDKRKALVEIVQNAYRQLAKAMTKM